MKVSKQEKISFDKTLTDGTKNKDFDKYDDGNRALVRYDICEKAQKCQVETSTHTKEQPANKNTNKSATKRANTHTNPE